MKRFNSLVEIMIVSHKDYYCYKPFKLKGDMTMTFELKGYDVTYTRDDQTARIYNDGERVLEAKIVGKLNIFEVVRSVALYMVTSELLTEEDISDVLKLCDPEGNLFGIGTGRRGDRTVSVG